VVHVKPTTLNSVQISGTWLVNVVVRGDKVVHEAITRLSPTLPLALPGASGSGAEQLQRLRNLATGCSTSRKRPVQWVAREQDSVGVSVTQIYKDAKCC
jgi:hypothetical protein